MNFSSERSSSHLDASLPARTGVSASSNTGPHVIPAGKLAPAEKLVPADKAAPASPPAAAAPAGTWVLDEVFPSCTETARRLLETIMQQVREGAWDDSDRFAVHLALEEGLINAIKHGNKYNRNKHVHIRCVAQPDRVHIEIEDEGVGFVPEEVPDCTENENLECCSGRGIALMRSFMSHVEYQNDGRRLVMDKTLGG